jgi:hypothetical protein
MMIAELLVPGTQWVQLTAGCETPSPKYIRSATRAHSARAASHPLPSAVASRHSLRRRGCAGGGRRKQRRVDDRLVQPVKHQRHRRRRRRRLLVPGLACRGPPPPCPVSPAPADPACRPEAGGGPYGRGRAGGGPYGRGASSTLLRGRPWALASHSVRLFL